MRAVRSVLFVLVAAAVLTPAKALADDEPPVVRVFRLRHCSVAQASELIRPFLSEDGTVTTYPGLRRLSVQDQPEVVADVARLIAELDRRPPRFQITVELLQASKSPPREGVSVAPDPQLARMFPFYSSFRQIGEASVEGDADQPVSAELGDRYQIAFTTSLAAPDVRRVEPEVASVESDGDQEVGSSTAEELSARARARRVELAQGQLHAPRRVRLERFRLLQRATTPGRSHSVQTVLETTLTLAPQQVVMVAAQPSEESDKALVLVVSAFAVDPESGERKVD